VGVAPAMSSLAIEEQLSEARQIMLRALARLQELELAAGIRPSILMEGTKEAADEPISVPQPATLQASSATSQATSLATSQATSQTSNDAARLGPCLALPPHLGLPGIRMAISPSGGGLVQAWYPGPPSQACRRMRTSLFVHGRHSEAVQEMVEWLSAQHAADTGQTFQDVEILGHPPGHHSGHPLAACCPACKASRSFGIFDLFCKVQSERLVGKATSAAWLGGPFLTTRQASQGSQDGRPLKRPRSASFSTCTVQ
jgi:hypothetical protein